jgi:hypothetical protein
MNGDRKEQRQGSLLGPTARPKPAFLGDLGGLGGSFFFCSSVF